MSNRPHTKARLVKCPRCSKILPEPEQVPLYTCGSCGTILRAKYYKGENKTTGLESHERVASESNGIANTHKDGESSGSSQRTSPLAEHLSERNEVKDQNVSEDHNSEQNGGVSSAHYNSSSKQLGACEIKQNVEIDSTSDISDLEDRAVNQKEQQPGVASSTNEASLIEDSSREPSRMIEPRVLESKEQLQSDQGHSVLENTEAQHIARINGVMEGEDKQRQVVDVREASASNKSLFTESKGTASTESDHLHLHENGKEPSDGEIAHEMISAEEKDYNRRKKIPSLAMEKSNGEINDDCLQEQLQSMKLVEASSSVEIARDRNDVLTARSGGNLQVCRDSGEPGSCNVSPDPQYEGDSLNVTEILREEIEEFNDGSGCRSETVRHVSSPKASRPANNARKEDDRALKRYIPRSLTKGSLAYNGSVSSFDGNDDHLPEQEEIAAERSSAKKNAVLRDAYRSSSFQNDPKNSSQILLDEKLKSRSMLEEAELIEEDTIPVRNRMKPNRDGFIPQIPLYQTPEMVYETGSSSSYIHDEFPLHQVHRHPYRHNHLDPWSRNRYAQKWSTDRRRYPEPLWRENEFVPMYHNYESSSDGIYPRLRHHGYADRRRAESLSLSGSLPRRPYSDEMFNARYQMRDLYVTRHADDLRWSAQLPQPPAYYWDSYESCPASPRRFMEPEPYHWSHDHPVSASDDQRRRDLIMRRLYLREKRQTVKRHIRPVAGGAPFITCYFCFKVLQLPQDFLLSKRRNIIHRLKCGACLSILEFSLDNESCLAPCIPTDDALEEAEAITGRKRDDSIETGSRNSRREERRERLIPEGGHSFQARQMKVTWQLPSRRSKSPLHRLMGYSSPHDIFNDHEDEDEDVDW